MGQGWIFADWVLALLALLCLLAHSAVLRAPDIPESSIIERIRWLKVGGLAILTLRFWYVLLTSGDILIPVPTEMGITLVLGAELYGSLYRLFPSRIDAHDAQRLARRKTHKDIPLC